MSNSTDKAHPWALNYQQWGNALAELLGQEVSTLDPVLKDSTFHMAARIAGETGYDTEVDAGDLWKAAQAGNNRPDHYLHIAPQTSSLALLTLFKLTGVSITDDSSQALLAQVQGGVTHDDLNSVLKDIDKPNLGLIRGLRVAAGRPLSDAVDAFIYGPAYLAASLTSTASYYLPDRLASLRGRWGARVTDWWPAQIAPETETVANRLNIVLQNAIQVFDEMPEQNMVATSKVNFEYEKSGRQHPAARAQVAEDIGRLRGVMEAQPTDADLVGYLETNPEDRKRVEDLFYYIEAFGSRPNRRAASEFLAVWQSGVFEERATSPIGQATPHFPQVDVGNRTQVLEFVRSIVPQFWSNLDEGDSALLDAEIWKIWSETLTIEGLTADDIRTDLDKTLYDYTMPRFIWGPEHVRLRKLIISYLALTLRDQAAIHFASHTVADRLKDFANDPRLAALRLVLFLRTQADPNVTTAEVDSFGNNVTYVSLAQRELAALERFQAVGYDFSQLTPEERVRVARSLTTPSRGDRVLGSKSYAAEANRVLIDDTKGKVVDYVLGGGMGGIILGEYDYDPVFLMRVVKMVKDKYAQTGKPVIVDLSGGNVFGELIDEKETKSELVAEEAPIEHSSWRMYDGYTRPVVDIIHAKGDIERALTTSGRYQAVLEEAHGIVATALSNVENCKVEVAGITPPHLVPANAAAYDPRIEQIYQNLSPPDNLIKIKPGELPDLHDILDIRFDAEGSLVITPKGFGMDKSSVSFKALLKSMKIFVDYGPEFKALVDAGRLDDAHRLLGVWFALSLVEQQTQVVVKGWDNIAGDQNQLFAPDHKSPSEYHILIGLLLGKGQIAGITYKEEMMRNPIARYTFGVGLRYSPYFVPLNRGDTKGSIARLERTAEMLARPGAPSLIHFFPGTRARKDSKDARGARQDGIQEPLKKGGAWLAVDAGLDVVPVHLEGIGKVTGTGVDLRIGTQQTVTVQVGEPLPITNYTGMNRDEAVAVLTEDLRVAWQDLGIRLSPQDSEQIQTVASQGSEVLQPRQPVSRNPQEAKKPVSRPLRVFQGVLGKIHPAIPTAPLEASMYTPQERMRYALEYVGAKWELVKKLFALLGGYTYQNDAGLRERFGQGLKYRVARFLGSLSRALGNQPFSLTRGAIAEAVDSVSRNPRYQLPEVDKAVVVETLSAIANNYHFEEVPEVLKARIAELYGPAGADAVARFTQYTLYYLNALVEGADKALKFNTSDVALDDAPVREARDTYTALYQQTVDQAKEAGVVLDDTSYAVVRDARESVWITTGPVNGNEEQNARWQDLLAAEAKLGSLVAEGASTAQLEAARFDVQKAYEQYSQVSGLAASHETFSYFDRAEVGYAIPHHYLEYVLTNTFGRTSEVIGILTLHTQLQEDRGSDNLELRQQYVSAVRALLDVPGNARSLQVNLMALYGAQDFLLKHPADELHAIVEQYGNDHPESKSNYARYENAYTDYHSFSLSLPANPTYDMRLTQERLRGALITEAVALFTGEAGLRLVPAAIRYVGEAASSMTGMESVLDAHARYQTERRTWAFAERERREGNVADYIDYRRWKAETVYDLFTQEAQALKMVADGYVADMDAQLKDAGIKNGVARVTELAGIVLEIEELKATDKATKTNQHADRITSLTAQAATLRASLSSQEQSMEFGITRYIKGQRAWDKAMTELEQHQAFQLSHIDNVANPQLIEGTNPHPGHLITYNRKLEQVALATTNLVVGAQQARQGMDPTWNLSAPLSYMMTAFTEKLTPTYNANTHRERARDTFGRYIGEFVAPVVTEGVWMLEQGLPADVIAEPVGRWGLETSTRYHHYRFLDRTPQEALPGTLSFSNSSHNTGWWGDYGPEVARKPHRPLMAKLDLGEKMPPGIGAGVSLIGSPMPNTREQAPITGSVIDVMTRGVSTGPLLRAGGQDTLIYGAATMAVPSELSLDAIVNPGDLLDVERTTGMELPGFGKSVAAMQGARALRGTGAYEMERNIKRGGHKIGSKPDKPMGMRPAEVHYVVTPVDVDALPDGRSLMTDGVRPSTFTNNNIGELTIFADNNRDMADLGAMRVAPLVSGPDSPNGPDDLNESDLTPLSPSEGGAAVVDLAAARAAAVSSPTPTARVSFTDIRSLDDLYRVLKITPESYANDYERYLAIRRALAVSDPYSITPVLDPIVRLICASRSASTVGNEEARLLLKVTDRVLADEQIYGTREVELLAQIHFMGVLVESVTDAVKKQELETRIAQARDRLEELRDRETREEERLREVRGR
ncbi:1-acyl-sn-glycerol-3-phosphate acyltransferase [bacterium]|nr:1-acyl-sn-glycerol-3-phosphate acyltransferase [bacterium]